MNTKQSKINFGKQLVVSEMERRGYTIYTPNSEKNKPFDYICYSNNVHGNCNHEYFCLSIFVKPRRFLYDTGFDLSILNHLKEVSQLRPFIMFVDHLEQRIYGNWLSILNQSENGTGYPMNDRTKDGKWIRYFDMNKMKTFKELLLPEEIDKLM